MEKKTVEELRNELLKQEDSNDFAGFVDEIHLVELEPLLEKKEESNE